MLLVFAKTALIALALFFAWKYLERRRNWHQVQAEVLEHDYDAIRRARDSHDTDGESSNAVVNMTVSFRGARGSRHTAKLRTSVQDGHEVPTSVTLWYRKDDPSETSENGPVAWLGAVVGALAALVALFLVR